MTEWLHFHFSLSCIGEGNGNPLQWSCLENPRVGRAWWAAAYGVAQSRTRLKRLSSSSRDTLSHQSEWPSLKSLEIVNGVESVEKKKSSYTAGGNVNWCNHCRNSMEIPQNTKDSVAIGSSNPIPGQISRQNYNLKRYLLSKDTFSPMCITALFTIGTTWKQPKCPSTYEWRRHCIYTHWVMEYQISHKNEIMPLSATWMNLEIIILSGVSQKDKDKYHMICLYVSKRWPKWTQLWNGNWLTGS